jgi:hypothetical protein
LRSQITELGKAKTVRNRTGARGAAEGDEEEEAGGDKNDDEDKSEAGDGQTMTSAQDRRKNRRRMSLMKRMKVLSPLTMMLSKLNMQRAMMKRMLKVGRRRMHRNLRLMTS